MNEISIIEKLKELGFNTYESKVYVALLKKHPATGYEISKESGVPQARAYDTLKTLETANVVVANGGKPITYTPISPEELLDRKERTFTGCVSYLREALPCVLQETAEPVTILRGTDPVYQHAMDMIRHAKQSVFMHLFREDAVLLHPLLLEAKQRGIVVRIIGYDNCFLEGLDVYQHARGQEIALDINGRWLTVAVDGREGMVGRMTDTIPPPQALVSRNPNIVCLINELVLHDIMLLELEAHFQPEVTRVFGKDLQILRRKIMGEVRDSLCP